MMSTRTASMRSKVPHRIDVHLSRLSPFEKLPAIGVRVPHPPEERRDDKCRVHPRHRIHEEENWLELAIHCPSGRRLVNRYRCSSRLLDVLSDVRSVDSSVSSDVYFSTGDRPKRQFQDLNLTLRQAKILDRSMTVEGEESSSSSSRVDFYRQLLVQSRVFLTELDGDDERSSTLSRSETTTKERPKTAPGVRSSVRPSGVGKEEFASTRQRCYQRLLACSRKKLRLLTIQEQNERRHAGFQRFIDNLDEKRCANIRRYQMELKEYLLNRLETDRLREELLFLNQKIDQLKKEKENYSMIIDIVQKAIPLFPSGLLQGGSDGVKSLILRYQTLVENKEFFEDRDFSQEKQERRQKLQRLILAHNTRITQLSTRLAQLHNRLNDIEKKESIREEKVLYELDLTRLTNTTLSQLLSSINYLYDRYRLEYQVKQSTSQPTPRDKLRTIQEFILYRIDLLQRSQ